MSRRSKLKRDRRMTKDRFRQLPGGSQPAARAKPKEPEKKRVTLTPLQNMAVRLLQARELIQRKNNVILNMQRRYSARVSELEGEVAELATQVTSFQNNSEANQNTALQREVGLPEGALTLKIDEQTGELYYEVDADESDQTAAPAKPEKKDKTPAPPVNAEDLDEDEEADEDDLDEDSGVTVEGEDDLNVEDMDDEELDAEVKKAAAETQTQKTEKTTASK